ncbi:MAG: lycopene cyclase family protein [Ekhidna sp.]
MDSTDYDYAIVGAGAAGMHLALALIGDAHFDSKKILIIEKSKKDTNDRTWCFWEKEKGNWDAVVHQSWKSTEFVTPQKSQKFDLGSYTYKMVKSIDFYAMAKQRLMAASNVTWVNDEVTSISQGAPNSIITSTFTYEAYHVFDSQISADFHNEDNGATNILQHFKGWFIESPTPAFDKNSFIMMDFRQKHPDTTSFIYVLPLDAKRALLEFTFFSPELVSDDTYDQHLETYIRDILRLEDYTINEIEQGVIPMSNYPFYKESNEFITKIGTAGSWVKGSSGYSFKNAERYSAKIIDNLKRGEKPSKKLFKKRFKLYDSIFLDVLYHNNHLGERVFSDMYNKNDIEKILAFLDEETSILDELKIIASFEWWPFTKALIKHMIP